MNFRDAAAVILARIFPRHDFDQLAELVVEEKAKREKLMRDLINALGE